MRFRAGRSSKIRSPLPLSPSLAFAVTCAGWLPGALRLSARRRASAFGLRCGAEWDGEGCAAALRHFDFGGGGLEGCLEADLSIA